ncbi:MAG TPA: hypothetical protein VN784_16110 [Candidatus Limnocylindrales bacterium]|nr:hypothetical protein [Candidatus Limnocylindrales bacterium]
MSKQILQVIGAGIFTCFVMTGCDSFNGVYRTARLQHLPSNAAIEAALHDVPATQRVRYSVSQPIAPSDTRILRQFDYSSADSGGVVAIQQTETGGKTLTLYRMWIDYIPPPEVIGDTCALMDEVYASLLRHIPGLPPKEDLKETLVRVKKP